MLKHNLRVSMIPSRSRYSGNVGRIANPSSRKRDGLAIRLTGKLFLAGRLIVIGLNVSFAAIFQLCGLYGAKLVSITMSTVKCGELFGRWESIRRGSPLNPVPLVACWITQHMISVTRRISLNLFHV